MSTAHLECGPALPWAKAEENPKPANFPPEDIASLGLKAGDKIEIYWTVHYEDEDKEDEPRQVFLLGFSANGIFTLAHYQVVIEVL